MDFKIVIYAVMLLVSTFAVSGINFDGFIKRNHIWEARFFSIILIITFGYILTNFIYDIVGVIEVF